MALVVGAWAPLRRSPSTTLVFVTPPATALSEAPFARMSSEKRAGYKRNDFISDLPDVLDTMGERPSGGVDG